MFQNNNLRFFKITDNFPAQSFAGSKLKYLKINKNSKKFKIT